MGKFRSFFWHRKHRKRKGRSRRERSVEPEIACAGAICHSPDDVVALLDALPAHDSDTSEWLVWSFPEALDTPLHLARAVPALAAHPRFRELFERPAYFEDIVNHYVPLFAYPDRLCKCAIAAKLDVLEFFARFVARQLETSSEFGRAQLMLFKARTTRSCPVEIEYRLFSILTENLSQTAHLSGQRHGLELLVTLAGSFPVGSALHVIAVRYILGVAGPDFPYFKLMEMLSRQKITDHLDLIVFVDVMNLCRRRVCRDAIYTLLRTARKDIWRRSTLSIIKTRLDPRCFDVAGYHAPIRKFVCHVLHTMEHAPGEKAELARTLIVDLIALGIPPLGQIIQECATEMRCHDV
jgi:hypothetical protein